jgi:Circadian oscillating protein COP23
MHILNANSPKIFLSVGLVTALNLLSISPLPVSANAPTHLVKFDCTTDIDPPILKVTTPNRSYPLIYWRGKYPDGPEIQCIRVRNRFRYLWNQGSLNHIKSGRSRKSGRDMVCGTSNIEEECNESNKLFDVFGNTGAVQVATDLKCRLASRCNEPIDQGSGDEFIIDFQDLVKKLSSQ